MQSGNPYQTQQREALPAQEGKCWTSSQSYRKELAHHHQGQRSRTHSIQSGPHPYPAVEALATESPTLPLSPDTKYCAVCTPLGKLCPNKFPVSQGWEEDYEEEERKEQDKGEDNFSVYLDWGADLEEQDRKNQELKHQKENEGKTPQNSPTFLLATIFTLQPPESSIKQFSKRSSETPTEEENKCKTLTILLGHESSKKIRRH